MLTRTLRREFPLTLNPKPTSTTPRNESKGHELKLRCLFGGPHIKDHTMLGSELGPSVHKGLGRTYNNKVWGLGLREGLQKQGLGFREGLGVYGWVIPPYSSCL